MDNAHLDEFGKELCNSFVADIKENLYAIETELGNKYAHKYYIMQKLNSIETLLGFLKNKCKGEIENENEN